MTAEEMQKQIVSMMPTPKQIVEHVDKKLEEKRERTVHNILGRYANDVYKEAEEYLKEQERQDNLYNDEGDIYESAVVYTFIAGAKWQREQYDKCVKRAEEWLEENSYKYRDEVTDSFRDVDMINDLVKFLNE